MPQPRAARPAPGGPPPEGFELHQLDGGWLWLRRDHAAAKESLSLPPRELAARHPSGLHGRGEVALLELPCADGSRSVAILRPYRRGGLVAQLFEDRYLDATRARDELELYLEAQRRGIESLEVLAAMTWRCKGPGYRHGIVTRRLDAVEDLAATMTGRAPTDVRSAMTAAGRAIAKMHDAGLDHADLNLKNVLIACCDEGPKAFIIDLDRSRFASPPLSQARRDDNMLRLLRSFLKLQRRAPARATTRAALELARGYLPDRAARRRLTKVARLALARSLRFRYSSWRDAGREGPST
jgi:3-deoxy-D-manno-octulosonic acid kinase